MLAAERYTKVIQGRIKYFVDVFSYLALILAITNLIYFRRSELLNLKSCSTWQWAYPFAISSSFAYCSNFAQFFKTVHDSDS